MTFGLKIKAYRKELKLTQVRLAQLLAVSIRTVKYWEDGRVKPRKLTARLVEDYLDDAVVTYHLKGKIWPLQLGTMKERYAGVEHSSRGVRSSKSNGRTSGTTGEKTNSGSTSRVPLKEPEVLQSVDENDDIRFG